MLSSIPGKQLVFTVTTGRSGTGLLQKLFSLLPNVTALHEPVPKFSDVLRRAQAEPGFTQRFWLDIKLPAIYAMPGAVYVETSHLFCKGFLEPLLDLGAVPHLVILRRSARDVARSLYELDTIPARTALGQSFLLSPDDPGVLPLRGSQELHDYQLCYWYCLEIERRAQMYLRQVRALGGLVAETSFAELIGSGFRRVVQGLGLEMANSEDFDARVAGIIRNPVNDKRDIKRQISKPPLLNIEELEREVVERVPVAQRGMLRR